MSKENVQEVLSGNSNSKILSEKKEIFRENLRVQPIEQPITVFPTDEEILDKMNPNDRMYVFSMDNIDRRIKIAKLTKSRRATIFVS